jgi:hypothetical protein
MFSPLLLSQTDMQRAGLSLCVIKGGFNIGRATDIFDRQGPCINTKKKTKDGQIKTNQITMFMPNIADKSVVSNTAHHVQPGRKDDRFRRPGW